MTEGRGTVGERGQLGVGGSTDRLKAAPDHHGDLRLGLRHGAEHLPATAGGLDVADANLQMSFAVVAAADECRVYGDGDRRRARRWRYRGGVAELLASLKRVATQCLRAPSGLDRQKVRQKASGDAIRHQSRNMCSQLVELRRGPAIGQPADTRLAMTTVGAAKPRQPHRHRAEQRRHPMKPPVLDVTRLTTSRAIRTQNHVIVGLHGDHRLLQARQDLLCLGQRQPQLRDIAESHQAA